MTDGNSSREIALSMGADANRALEVIERRNQEYWSILQDPPPLRPNVRETLAVLRGRFKLAIVTGCGREQLDLVNTSSHLLARFDLIVTSDECSCSNPPPKPY